MREEWSPIRVGLRNTVEVIGIAAKLGKPRNEIVGAMHAMWGWFQTETTDGFAKGLTPESLDAICECPGLAKTSETFGWMVITSDGMRVPRWDVHNSKGAKRRRKTAKRVAKNRRNKSNAGVTPEALPVTQKSVSVSVYVPVGCSLPKELDTGDFRKRWEEWFEYRKESKLPPWKPRTVTKNLGALESWGHDRACAAIDTAIRCCWKGLFEPKEFTNGNRAAGSGRNGAVAERAAKEAREYPRSTAPIPIFRPGSVAATPVESGGTAKAR